jgi:signal transduction histidine kinase
MDGIMVHFVNREHPLFGGWAVARPAAMIPVMSGGSSGKNELGMRARITTMAVVPRPFPSRVWWVAFGVTVGVWSQLGAAEDAVRYSARPAVTEVVLGGRAMPVTVDAKSDSIGETDYRGLSLLPREFPLTISIATAAPGTPPIVRLRTRLEGWEDEWQDHESQMWLVLRFLDENNRAVSSAAFIRKGESPGWGGLPQNSRLHRRVDEAVVPERSNRVQILLVSGGTPRTTGFWAVRRLRLTAWAPEQEATAGTPIYQLEHLRGSRLDSPQGNPDGWTRDGTGLSTPRLFSHAEADGGMEPLLALVDGDPTNTGGWLQLTTTAARVVPGQRLRLECEEMHSIGRGRDAEVIFRALPVGNYLFRVWATDELGRPTGPSLRLPIEVRPAFYATRWFRLLGAGLVAAALLGGVRYFTWRKMQRELQRLEQRRAVEEERTRMARDLHDEMGARFTQISLLAGRALKSAPADESVREPIRNINGAVKELAAALEEIVWAANPSRDSLEGFSNYLSQYAAAVLRDAGLRCRLDIPTLLPARTLGSGVRHRLMMAVKEALNNALKHARATEVCVQLELDGQRLRVTVADNGAGFDPATVKHGNGLDHSVRRMEEIGGTCAVESRSGAGTQVRLSVPLPMTEERP